MDFSRNKLMRILPQVDKRFVDSPKWIPNKYRILVLQTNPRCEVCGKPAIEVHHKDKNEHNNCFGNLVAVCHKCHHDIHRKRSKPKINYYNRLYRSKRSMKRRPQPNLEQSTI